MGKADVERETVMVDSVMGCARCGEDHGETGFEKLDRPFHVYAGAREANGDPVSACMFNFWAPCPTNGQPILMRIVEVFP